MTNIQFIRFSLEIMAIATVVIAVATVIIMLHLTKIKHIGRASLDGIRCISCRMIDSPVCMNGYEHRCDVQTKRKEK